MELSNLLQKRISILAVFGVSAFVGLMWTVGDGVVRYASLYNQGSTQVLGEKVVKEVSPQCIPTETFKSFLSQTQKSVNLYAPDKTVTLALEPLLSCFVAQGCESANFACAEGKIALDKACVTDYFAKYPLQVEQTRIVTGAGAVAQVQVQDWSVNYTNLTEQLMKAVSDEIKYCQIAGNEEQTRQNIGNLQLVVADELPSMKSGSFTTRFIEIDESKEKVYFWNEGVYQTLSLIHGARLPKESIYHRSDVDLTRIMSRIDADFLTRNSQKVDYVVVHK